MAYQKQIWENAPSTNSPLSADRLNHMEDGIYNASLVANSYNESNANAYSCNYVNSKVNTIPIVEKGKIGSNQMTPYQIGGDTNRLYNLTFSNTYTNPPIVVACLYNNDKTNYGIQKVAVGNITNTGCELLLGVNVNSSGYGIEYIVIGND